MKVQDLSSQLTVIREGFEPIYIVCYKISHIVYLYIYGNILIGYTANYTIIRNIPYTKFDANDIIIEHTGNYSKFFGLVHAAGDVIYVNTPSNVPSTGTLVVGSMMYIANWV